MSWITSRSDFDSTQDQILTDILLDTTHSWWLQGYAGTGKTMLARMHAKQCAQEGKTVLLVCFNRTLRDENAHQLQASGVVCETYHSLAYKLFKK